MAVTEFSPAFDDFLDFLVEKASPGEILAYRPDEAAQQRAVYLTERRKAALLTPEENAELEQMLEFDLLVALLKARALKASKASHDDHR